MKAFEVAFGTTRRESILRLSVAVVLLGGLIWLLPVRRPGEGGGHHAEHARDLDAFERAGVTEFKEGQRGPAFRLATLDNRQSALDDFKDRLVVLNFWATWCQPCTLEMPTLEALWRQYRDRGLVVLGVSVDRGAPRSLLDPYVKNLGLTFPILLDPDMKTAGAWRVTALPATFVVKPGGEVTGMAIGAREWNGHAGDGRHAASRDVELTSRNETTPARRSRSERWRGLLARVTIGARSGSMSASTHRTRTSEVQP